MTKPCAVSTSGRAALGGWRPRSLVGDRLLAVGRDDRAALGLAHDLARDHDDVAVGEPARPVGPGEAVEQRHQQGDEVVAGAPRGPRDAHHLQAAPAASG
jgi:hypothetical protein